MDSVLTQMPVMRVTVKTDHPENFTKETALAAARQELARQQPKILNYYQAQQANSRASGLDLSKTHMVSDSIELRHTNLNGTPILEIIINVDALSSQLCMMVLYSSNKIAAFDMKALDKGKLAKVYGASLSQSSWGNEPLLTTQYRYDKNWTAVYGPASFAGSTITASDYLCLSRTHNKNVGSCLTQSVTSRAGRITLNDPREPILANNGSTVYTPYDIYDLSQAITFVGDNASTNNPNIDGPDVPFAIDATGVNYYLTEPNTGLVWSGVFAEPISSIYVYALTYMPDYPLTPTGVVYPLGYVVQQLPVAYEETTAELPFIGYYRATDVTYNYAVGSWIGTTYFPNDTIIYTKPDMSLSWPVHTCTQSGGVDQLDVQLSLMSAVYSGTWNINTANVVLSWSFEGVSDSIDWETNTGSVPMLLAWPPGVDGKRYFCRMFTSPSTVESADVHTPYGVFTGIPARSYFTGGGGGLNPDYQRRIVAFRGLLHASNGKHILQAFRTNADPHYFLDSVEITNGLATAIGGTADDIQCILLDVPLARIKQFK